MAALYHVLFQDALISHSARSAFANHFLLTPNLVLVDRLTIGSYLTTPLNHHINTFKRVLRSLKYDLFSCLLAESPLFL